MYDHPGLAVSVVIPCYDEEAVIERTVIRVAAALAAVTDRYEIVVGDDGSTDDSPRILAELAANRSDLDVVSCRHVGMGHVCRQMYARVRGAAVIQMDADLAMDPAESIPQILAALEHADCVSASRFSGIEADYPWRRRVASRAFRLFSRALLDLPVDDTQSGSFGIDRDVLQSLPLQADGFEIHVEMFAQLGWRGCTVVEIPVRFVHQTESGEVSVLRSGPKMVMGTFRIWRTLRRLRAASPVPVVRAADAR